jgi:hypothetical protein
VALWRQRVATSGETFDAPLKPVDKGARSVPY